MFIVHERSTCAFATAGLAGALSQPHLQTLNDLSRRPKVQPGDLEAQTLNAERPSAPFATAGVAGAIYQPHMQTLNDLSGRPMVQTVII